MPGSFEFLIAQYFRDPMRREAKNVGLVVIDEGSVTARFIGETNPGDVDLRSTRWANHPYVYRKWIRYWREQLAKPYTSELLEQLTEQKGGNYEMVYGGSVTDAGEDNIATVRNNLFEMLVHSDEMEQAEAIAYSDAEPATDTVFQATITKEFKSLGILGYQSNLPHPVLRNVDVPGVTTSHRPSYYQSNGSDCVMEAMSLSPHRPKATRFHAGFAANMFRDILEKKAGKAEAIAIIRATPDELRDKTVRYACEMLGASGRIVNWLSDLERQEFLKERERVAYLPPSLP